MELNEKIILFRESIGISTNKLANKAGISQSYLRDIELGKKNPTVEVMSYICEALGISLADFFAEDETDIEPMLKNSLKNLDAEQQKMLANFINTLK